MQTVQTRQLYQRLAVAMLLLFSARFSAAYAFGFTNVESLALAASKHAYQPPKQAPKSLSRLNYDQYRGIHFKPSHALWPQRHFHVQFFAPGYRYTTPVRINIIDANGVHRQAFKRSDFVTGKDYPQQLPADTGFAGFRLHFDGYAPHQTVDTQNNEVIAFLGASYFRAKAAGEQYGVSARGIAINTIASTPEEFPAFREFWIKKPCKGAKSVTVFALLDGPSVSGAYQFVITPGSPASVDVKASLFLRHPVHELGLAAFSSMYLYGVGDHRPAAYLRPAVHDSQGLLIRDAHDRWSWRPLANPKVVKQYSFTLDAPKGFGLIQRNRSPFNYQSPSMAYQARSSVWVAPKGSWGPGQLRLVEIPSPAEYNDNIALFWTPRPQPAPHQAFHYAYRMRWGNRLTEEPLAKVTATLSTRPSLAHPTRFMIDFSGTPLAPHAQTLAKAIVQVGKNGRLISQRLERLGKDRYRLSITVASQDDQPVQLRAYLTRAGTAITETWDYVLAPVFHPQPIDE